MQTIEQLIKAIEEKSDFDVLNYNKFTIDVINRYGDDGKVDTIQIYGKTEKDIIDYLKRL